MERILITGIPSLSDTTDVEVTVQDVNDNAPVFTTLSYQTSVPEDALVGTSVIQVQASDVDLGLNGRVRWVIHSILYIYLLKILPATSRLIKMNYLEIT